MVRGSKGKVRQGRQEEASPTEGTVSQVKDNPVVSECKPKAVKTVEDHVWAVVRKKQVTLLAPDSESRTFKVNPGDYFYNKAYKTIVHYDPSLENKWCWSSYMIGRDSKFTARKIIDGWKHIAKAVFSGELILVDKELVTLCLLTGENHIERMLNEKRQKNAA